MLLVTTLNPSLSQANLSDALNLINAIRQRCGGEAAFSVPLIDLLIQNKSNIRSDFQKMEPLVTYCFKQTQSLQFEDSAQICKCFENGITQF